MYGWLKYKKKDDRFLIARIIILVVIMFFYILKCIELNFIQDDAYTTFRYLKNFISGSGLVFNTREYVEGYTNFLWLLILTPFYTGKINIEFTAQILSIFFGVLTLVITFFLSENISKRHTEKEFGLSRVFTLLPVYLIMMSGGFSYWGASGMESSLFVFLVLTGIFLYVKKYDANRINSWFIIFFILASFTRPEGIFIFFLIITHKFLYNFLNKSASSSKEKISGALRKKDYQEIGLFALPVILHSVFRLVYYGYPFPNTFYAKVGLSNYYLLRGLNYFWTFLESNMLYGLVLVLPIFLLKSELRRFEISLFYFLIFFYIVYIVLIGGDVLPINRFFLPVLPLIYILLLSSILNLKNKLVIGKYVHHLLNISIIISITIYGIFISTHEKPRINEMLAYEKGLVKKMKIYAGWVGEQQKIQDREMIVALSTIGAFSYFSDAKVIDLIGLTDEYIAHHNEVVEGIPDDFTESWKERRQNSSYILRVKPDYIIFPAGAKPSAFAESALFANNRFNYYYYPQLIYSEQLNQMLPIFTLKSKEQLAISDSTILHSKCDISFIKHYVNASNIFLKYLLNKDTSFLPRIEEECNEVMRKCEFKKADALTLLGYAYFHSGNKLRAKKCFEEAAALDKFNSSAHLYLKTIYFEEGDLIRAYKQIKLLRDLSPYAVPNQIDSAKF